MGSQYSWCGWGFLAAALSWGFMVMIRISAGARLLKSRAEAAGGVGGITLAMGAPPIWTVCAGSDTAIAARAGAATSVSITGSTGTIVPRVICRTILCRAGEMSVGASRGAGR